MSKKKQENNPEASAENQNGGPVNDQIVEIDCNRIAVHCVTSSPFIADAK